jgi:hypothetical protein
LFLFSAILGFTGLINQVQYHAAIADKISSVNSGGWNSTMNRNKNHLNFFVPFF